MKSVCETSFIHRLNVAQSALSDVACTRDLSALLRAIVEQAARLLNKRSGITKRSGISPSRCELYVCDDEGCLTCRAAICEGSGIGVNLAAGYGEQVARAVVEAGGAVLVERYDLWAGPASGNDASPFRTALALPLQDEDRRYGVLCVLSPAESPFSSIEVEALNLLAGQAVSAIRYVEALERPIAAIGGARDILDNLPIGVIVVDRRMRVVSLNPAAEEITGYAPSEAVGRHLSQLFNPDVWSEGSNLQRAITAGRPVQPTLTTLVSNRVRSDEDAPRILLGAAPLDEGCLLSLHPAGSFYQTQADRVSDLSHDVRAPLAAIRAYTELLIDGVDQDDPEIRQLCLNTIDQRACHLTELIVNLTDLVRLELGYFRPTKRRISLRHVAEEAVDQFHAAAQQQGVPVALDSPLDLPPISADRDMMDALLKILLSNAIKFSVAGGEVTVSLRSVEQDQTIIVADHGLGIAPQDRPHIFEVFYRGRSAIEQGIEGIGVGLTLARAIVEAHSGHIEVESDEGKGTRFVVTLPA